MRVLCVNHDNFSLDSYPWSEDDPQIGDVCEVERETHGADQKRKLFPAYVLKGYGKWVYDKRNFSPLTGQDETELVTEEFEEKYCVPVKHNEEQFIYDQFSC